VVLLLILMVPFPIYPLKKGTLTFALVYKFKVILWQLTVPRSEEAKYIQPNQDFFISQNYRVFWEGKYNSAIKHLPYKESKGGITNKASKQPYFLAVFAFSFTREKKISLLISSLCIKQNHFFWKNPEEVTSKFSNKSSLWEVN